MKRTILSFGALLLAGTMATAQTTQPAPQPPAGSTPGATGVTPPAGLEAPVQNRPGTSVGPGATGGTTAPMGTSTTPTTTPGATTPGMVPGTTTTPGMTTTTPGSPTAPGATSPGTTSPLPAPRANVDTNGPLPGANSFTENQVRERLETGGYSAVTGLRKDDQGIWRGTASRNGANVPVAVDYRGNIFQQ